MMRRFLLWLTARMPVEVITQDNRPYMERYYVGRLGKNEFFLHRFLASDPDRGLHDHPYAWSWSLVLVGWYMEELRGRVGIRTAVVKRFNWIAADKFHRVILPLGTEVWTLFAHGPRVKSWGFVSRIINSADTPIGRLFLWNAVSGECNKPFSDWHLTAPKGRDIRSRTS